MIDLQNIDLDSVECILVHKRIIQQNKFLNRIYIDFYKLFKKIKTPNKGLKVEIGSGGGFIKQLIPQVLTTDVVLGGGIDKKINLEKIDLKNGSVSAFYMLNVFHHIKNPKRALEEMQRCLMPGGKIIMIEPWMTLFSKFIYQNLHHENFDMGTGWKIKGKGRMSDANGALPWIVFKRDIERFGKLFPNLKVNYIKPHTYLKYLVSGGLSRKAFLPAFFHPAVALTEKFLSPFNKYLALFATIELTKTTS